MFVVKAFLKDQKQTRGSGTEFVSHHTYEAEFYTVGQEGDTGWLRFHEPAAKQEVTLWVGPRGVNHRVVVENRHGKTVENLRATEAGFAGL